MLRAVKISYLMMLTGELILGMLGNGFISLVHCMEWVKKGKVSPVDFLLTSLAVTRILQLWVTLLDTYIVVLFPHLYASGKSAKVVTFLWALSNHLTTWVATCLSIFYFLKIANFSHFLFIWLKRRMNTVLLVIFLGSLFLLCVNAFLQDTLIELWMKTYKVQKRNMTLDVDAKNIFYLNNVIFLSMTYIIPSLLSLISLLLLFLSLVRHTKNMQLNSMASRDSSTEAHKRAIRMVTTFLLLFITYCISNFISSWIFLKIQSYQAMMIFLVFTSFFPSVHSFVIILGNSKLRQFALKILWHLKFLRNSKTLN